MLKLRIRKHEVGLWFRHGDFKGHLAPGAYWKPGRLIGIDEVEVVDRMDIAFRHEMLDVLIDHPDMADQTLRVELADDERALLWVDGRLRSVLAPGRHVFWNGPAEVSVERYNVNDFVFTHSKIEAVLALPCASRHFDGVHVEPGEAVLVYRDGVWVGALSPGLHVYWRGAGRIERKIVDLREQSLDVAGQEIMTADKVTLRVNLLVTYRVLDARCAVESVADYAQALYRDAQLALREAVGTRVLDKLLTDKDAVGNEVQNALASRAEAFGVSVQAVGLRDVILPGDMKAILNEVILAQKQAEANLIRRREETAAARSQVNTAKLLADNPALTRMKELESLQEIMRGTKATFVFGNGGMLEQVRSLAGAAGEGVSHSAEPDEKAGRV